MLINAQSREELRIAVLSDSTLENYQVEVAEGGLTRGNIYRGVIANLQPALNAAFVDYGAGKNGFLAIQDVVAEARYTRARAPAGARRSTTCSRRASRSSCRSQREPENQKGAALTTNLSLAGRYLVLTPFDDTRGVSRKVEDEETRASAAASMVAKLELPDGLRRHRAHQRPRRDAGPSCSATSPRCSRVWKRIQNEAMQGNGARLLYSDQDLILRALRDHLDAAVEEVLVDDEGAFQQAARLHAGVPAARPDPARPLRRADSAVLEATALESQIERIFEPHRTAPLAAARSSSTAPRR